MVLQVQSGTGTQSTDQCIEVSQNNFLTSRLAFGATLSHVEHIAMSLYLLPAFKRLSFELHCSLYSP